MCEWLQCSLKCSFTHLIFHENLKHLQEFHLLDIENNAPLDDKLYKNMEAVTLPIEHILDDPCSFVFFFT